LCFAQASESTIIIVCDKTVFMDALKQFPDVEAKISRVAKYRKEKLEINLAQLKKEEPPTPNKAPRRMLKSTQYFYNVLLKSNKPVKKGKGVLPRRSVTPPKGISPINKEPQNDNLKSFKRLQEFLGALDLKKASKSVDTNQANTVNKAGEAFKRALKVFLLEE